MASFKKSETFFKFLAIRNDFLSEVPELAPSNFDIQQFLDVTNIITTSIRDHHFANESRLLVFKDTGSKTHRCHVADTQCRPNITAAFEGDWLEDGTTLWPCIQLVGEQAVNRKTQDELTETVISYLHNLLLARPDLNVAQGLLILDTGITFLFGVGGVGIRKFTVGWNNNELYKLLYVFIYRLYEPADFVDPSYIGMEVDLKENTAKYSIRINLPPAKDGQERTLDCHNFQQIYAGKPFGTRTHVLTNPFSDVVLEGKTLTVIKDQLCEDETPFTEHTILSHIHELGTVPGVVENVHHEKFTTRFCKDGSKHRLGFWQLGLPFSGIDTVQKMLETAFDVLEVVRYLRSHRQVLHRDISSGNVLYLGESSSIACPKSEDEVAERDARESSTSGLPVSKPVVEETAMNVESEASSSSVFAKTAEEFCFVKHLLGESENPHKTSTLLIDFNRSERLDSKLEDTRMDRTGTPLFIARAVELGGPVPLPRGPFIGAVAVPPCPASYALKHPDRQNKFPPSGKFAIDTEDATGNASTGRHDLEHDAESVFWLVLYWAMVAQPAEHSTERITSEAWTQLLAPAMRRNNLVTTLVSYGLPGLTHPVYEPLGPLIRKLAGILTIDRQWLPECDVRNDPEYVCEAFQRLILQFLLDNCGKAFMTHPIGPKSRAVEDTPHSDGLTSTAAARHDTATRKRPSPLLSREKPSKRLRSVNEE